MTTDNASNNIAMMRVIAAEFNRENLKFDAEGQHIRCLAHIINLAAQAFLKGIFAYQSDFEDEPGSIEIEVGVGVRVEVGVEDKSSPISKLRRAIATIRSSPQR